jgi:hypothetical protein
LRGHCPIVTLNSMKTISTWEFFHAPALVKNLRPGQSLLVTDNGNPNFTLTKAGNRPTKAANDLEREAKELFCGKPPQSELHPSDPKT